MKEIILLIFMLYFHIIDDYYLQGFLAQAKQKSWWKEHYPEPMYRHDYIIALIEHAFSWAVTIHIPLLLAYAFFEWSFEIPFGVAIFLFVTNIVLHALIDHMKANLKLCSLVLDQLMHVVQIYLTWYFWVN